MTSQKDPPILSLFHLRIASALTQHFTSSRLLFKHTSPPDYIDKLEAPAEPPFFSWRGWTSTSNLDALLHASSLCEHQVCKTREWLGLATDLHKGCLSHPQPYNIVELYIIYISELSNLQLLRDGGILVDTTQSESCHALPICFLQPIVHKHLTSLAMAARLMWASAREAMHQAGA